MAALSKDRNTPRLAEGNRSIPMAATQLIYGGAIVMRNAAGYGVKGATALGLVGLGRAEQRRDNSAGAAGDTSVDVASGVFHFNNSAAGDAIALADIGKVCYAVDDQTVAKTDGTGTRSIAGFIVDVDSGGVWVEFDETKVRTYIAGITLPVA